MSAYDNSNSGRRGRIIAISAIVLLGILVTLFMLKRHYENKIAARIAEELTYYSPIARLANAEVDVSLLSSSITLRDVVYVFNNLPLTLSIAKITSTGVDRDALLDSPGAMTHMDKLVMENMLFSSQTQEDALFSTAYYELNNLTYGYRDLRNTLREHKDSEDIAAWLRALLPHMGGTIFGNAVLRDTKMNVPFYHQTMFKINIAEASSSGLRPLDPAVDGFDAIEDSSHIRDFLMEFTNFVDHETVYFKLEEIGMKGGKFNRAGLLTAVGDLLEEGADVEAGLFNLLALAHNYAFERFYFKNLQVNGNNISFKLDDVDLTNHTPKEQGPDRLRNLRVTMGQRDIFTLEEAGLDKSVFSDRLVQIYSRMAELLNNEEIIREFADQPYETL
ncbi:MAG: hypothetical protein LBD82_03320, partial [Deltaproteobacteria bacterium]|nr:hypothetical protein [Deltaproteobacteria bacterium]